jgi:Clp amino terminal domain, pathogenicity island component
MSDGHLPTLDELATMVEESAPSIDEEPHVARLRSAIEIGQELGATGDALIERFVSEARAAELSWTQIGLQFGTSKQAAQKRYGPAAAGAWPGPWAPSAREALERASADARRLGHDYVGTEHALLGVLATQGGLAAEVLAELGVTREAILSTPCLTPGSGAPGTLQLMPRLKQGLERAQRIARGLGSDAPDTEHVLAGILAVPGAMAAEALKRVGAPASKVQTALARRLGTEPERLMATRRRRRRLLAKAG